MQNVFWKCIAKEQKVGLHLLWCVPYLYILVSFSKWPQIYTNSRGNFYIRKNYSVLSLYNFGNEYLQGSLTKSFEAYDNVIFLQKDFWFFVCFSQVPRVTTLFHLCSKVCDFSGPPKWFRDKRQTNWRVVLIPVYPLY